MRKNIKLQLLLLCVSFLAATNAYSAENYFIRAGAANMGTQDADESGDATVKRTMSWAEINGPVAFPFPGLTIMAGAKYHGQFLDYDNFSDQTFNGETITEENLPRNLHAGDVSLSAVKELGYNTTSVVRISPGIRSDVKDVSSDDIIINGMVLVRTQKGENAYGLGAAYTDTFGKQQTIPLVDIEWHVTDFFTVKGLLPVDIAAIWDIKPDLKAGFDANLNGYQYRLRDDAPWDSSIIKYTELQIGAFIDFKLNEMVHLIVRGGIVTAQHLEFRDKDNDNRILEEKDYDPSAYIAFNVAIPFPEMKRR